MPNSVTMAAVAAILLLAASAHAQAPAASPAVLTQRFLQQVSDLELWGGLVQCSSNAQEAPYQDAFGWADRRKRVALTPDIRLPIAANTMLMTAVAVHQLAEDGKVSLTADIKEYVNADILGLPDGKFCPRLNTSDPKSGGCQTITLDQLLSHTSGLWDAFSCTFENETKVEEWRRPYCKQAASGKLGDMLQAPLQSEPGKAFSYANVNFWLAGHIVWQASGKGLDQYLADKLFAPLNMSATFMDFSQTDAPQNLTMSNGGYTTRYTVSLDANSTVSLNTKVTARPRGNGTDSYDSILAGALGAAAVVSNAADMHHWYRTLFSQPKDAGIEPKSLAMLTQAFYQIKGSLYQAQGVVVDISDLQAPVYLSSGNIWNFYSYPSIKWGRAGADYSPVCVLLGNTAAQVQFPKGSKKERAAFTEKCDEVGLDAETLLGDLAAGEPVAVADMTPEERTDALLAHLCIMDRLGLDSNGYVSNMVAANIWGSRGDTFKLN